MPGTPTYPIHLFQAYGVELEYMIVDRDTLAVKPMADRLLESVAGEKVNEWLSGSIGWSNELVLHVIELKTSGPAPSLDNLADLFQREVRDINERLNDFNAVLMPSAAHPFMDPYTETRLWPHEMTEIYHAYNRIFDCRGHGWANLQSTHLNLPFADNGEFSRLHTAIRLILPILPALTASSPVLDGRVTGLMDTRLEYYRNNQQRIPLISGKVIPESVHSYEEYQQRILRPIYKAIAPYDTSEVLREEWLNSRGAIARFERGAIEIRVIDIQECPAADLAILHLIVETLKALTGNRWTSFEEQKILSEDDLYPVFMDTIRSGSQTIINDPVYLKHFGVTGKIKASELWREIIRSVASRESGKHENWIDIVSTIQEEGTLAERILKALGNDSDRERIIDIYRHLCKNLETGALFIP